MNIDKVPIIGKINKNVNILILNFTLLGIVAGVLGFSIIFFPKVLELLMSALLILSSIIFFHIAYNIYSYKSKYTQWLKD